MKITLVNDVKKEILLSIIIFKLKEDFKKVYLKILV